jgi:tight adherence protein C
MEIYVIGGLIFCLVGLALTSVYVALFGSHRALQERFEEMAIKLRVPDASDNVHAGVGRSFVEWAAGRMPEPKDTRRTERMSQSLVRAGFIRSGTMSVFRLVRIASAGIGVLLGFGAGFMLGDATSKIILLSAIGIAIGGYAPTYYLQRRARNRQSAITRELSDVLDLMVVCVEAGLGLFESIKVVGEETERQGQAIGTELTLVAGEVSAGASLGQALRSLGERTGVSDLKPLAATLIQSEQLGAQIGPALRSSSDAMRSRRRLRAEEAAQKTTIKILFPLVLFVLPAMLIVIAAPAMIEAIRTFTR